MPASTAEDLICNVKMSSTSTGTITGQNAVHELSNMDLAMKLHYLRAVYYFRNESKLPLDIFALKQPTLKWLDVYCSTAGRIRRSESGRPFVKCNDGGVRVIEAECRVTLDEWLEMDDPSRHRLLVSKQVLGPDLQFSPFVYLQFTWFKCGGMAAGLSWSHILGDIYTASTFINMWGQFLTRGPPASIQSSLLPRTKVERPTKPTSPPSMPPSVKRVQNTGDHWLPANASNMCTMSFHITDTQLRDLQSKISDKTGPFEVISALFWQSLAKVRGEDEPKRVTVCRNDSNAKGTGILSNKQIISTVETKSYIAGAKLSELAALIAGPAFDESKEIEAVVENDDGLSDLILYGANLTFVDLEDVNCNGLEVKGHKLESVYFSLDGVGSEGAVLVMPGPPASADGGPQGGIKVAVILPENQVSPLRNKLQLESHVARVC